MKIRSISLMNMIKQSIKSQLVYQGLPETERIREALQEVRREGWPYAPPDEGDLLYHFAREMCDHDALEVGFATGSTAAYISLGLQDGNGKGRLTSIDYAQDQYERKGEKLIQRLGFDQQHTLLEENSICCLPRLFQEGRRFGMIFLDGWKTFDHLWVDFFYAARMLVPGGMMVFDDAKMDAVQKGISLLKTYYLFAKIETYPKVGGWRQRSWHILTTRGLLPPYAALRKTCEIEQTPAGQQFDFWMPF